MWNIVYRIKGRSPEYSRNYPHKLMCNAEMAFWSDWYGGRLAVTPEDGVVKIERVCKIEG